MASFTIRRFEQRDTGDVVALSIRAWTPVFALMEPVVADYVYAAFYPDGWEARQTADISTFLREEPGNVWVAVDNERTDEILGWIGIRLHDEDRMGEIYILAVDPAHQRRGISRALMDHGMSLMREAGIEIVMVETGDDPGHAPSRATYEHVGFERWPVARYFQKL